MLYIIFFVILAVDTGGMSMKIRRYLIMLLVLTLTMSLIAPAFSATPTPLKAKYITGIVYNDTNYNGILNTGEKGIAGVTVKLYDPIAKKYTSVKTDSNGKYRFTVYQLTTYTITPVLPSPYVFSVKKSATVKVVQATNTYTANFFAYKAAEVIGMAYEDFDHNKKLTKGDIAFVSDSQPKPWNTQKVTVTLVGPSGTLKQVINKTGKFDFSGLKPGIYKISASILKPTPKSPSDEYWYLDQTAQYTITLNAGQKVNVTSTMGLFSIGFTAFA